MAGPHPAVAAVRLAVRRALTAALDGAGRVKPDDLVLAGCSGGPDSLALAAAVAFEAPKQGLRPGAVTVDHGLQAGSAELAVSVRATLRGLGLDSVLVCSVSLRSVMLITVFAQVPRLIEDSRQQSSLSS